LSKTGRTFINCNHPALATIEASRERVRNDKTWQWLEMNCGHDAIVSHPSELINLLLMCAK